MKHLKYIILLFCIVSIGCNTKVQNNDPKMTGKDHIVDKQIISMDSLYKPRKFYVPVYSNIYQRTRSDRTALTSTLSIHNTSETDTLFITRIDYYNTEGELVKKYLESAIYLNTFETIEYVVEEQDDSGGSGANFVVEWYGDKKLNPIFQAVMIGGLGSKSFSFTTEGVEFY